MSFLVAIFSEIVGLILSSTFLTPTFQARFPQFSCQNLSEEDPAPKFTLFLFESAKGQIQSVPYHSRIERKGTTTVGTVQRRNTETNQNPTNPEAKIY